jgi:RsmE family RNA methyltransferase
MARERIVSAAEQAADAEQATGALRPGRIEEYVGQRDLIERVRIAIEAARQCGRGDVPAVEEPAPLGTSLEVASANARIVFLPSAREPLGAHLATLAPDASITLLVGPEGGLDDDEVATTLAAGFIPCRLGTFVLRTETMAAAALGAIAALEPTAVDAPVGTI